MRVAAAAATLNREATDTPRFVTQRMRTVFPPGTYRARGLASFT